MNMKLTAKILHPPSKQKRQNALLVRLRTPTGNEDVQRRPLVLALAVDKSWSMKGPKMESTIQAASSFVNWLTRNDYLSIVAYGADVQMVQPLTKLAEKSTVINKIHTIQVGTSTNLSGGWLQALRAVESFPETSVYKRVILLTDGNPTLGIKESGPLVKIAADHFKRGISTTVIGFGDDFNEQLLRDIANAGGGNFYFVESPEEAGDIFFREFGDIGALYGQSIEVTVQFPPGVEYKGLISDYSHYTINDPENTGHTKEVVVQCGDIRGDDLRNLVFRLEVHPEKMEAGRKIDVKTSFYNLTEEMKLETHQTQLEIQEGGEDKEDADVKVEFLIANSANILVQASSLMQDNKTSEALNIIHRLIKEIDENLILAPDILLSLKNRLTVLESKVKTNAKTASKHLMASGSELYAKGSEQYVEEDVDSHDGIFEFRTKGDLDLYKCPEIKNIVQEKMAEGYKYMVFNLSDTGHIDSSAIGTFIQIVGWLRRRGGEFIVTNIRDAVKKVFEITRLENHIRVMPDPDAAKEYIDQLVLSRTETN